MWCRTSIRLRSSIMSRYPLYTRAVRWWAYVLILATRPLLTRGRPETNIHLLTPPAHSLQSKNSCYLCLFHLSTPYIYMYYSHTGYWQVECCSTTIITANRGTELISNKSWDVNNSELSLVLIREQLDNLFLDC